MYDDWGNEITLAELAWTPDAFAAQDAPSLTAVVVDDTDWAALLDRDEAFEDGPAVVILDDGFVLPLGEEYAPLGVKPGSADDWLTPLFTEGEVHLGEIVVTGQRFNPTTPGGNYNPANYGFWDGHDTSQTEPPPLPQELPDCVSDVPSNIDEDALMRLITYLTDEFRGVYNNVPGNTQIDSSRYEYGVLLYEHNGQLGFGDIQTDRSSDEVDVSTRGVPDGARIIGWMHNHPSQSYNGGVPSYDAGGDWDQRNNLANNNSLPRGITVDPSLLLILYSSADGRTRIYDKTDEDTRTPSCAI